MTAWITEHLGISMQAIGSYIGIGTLILLAGVLVLIAGLRMLLHGTEATTDEIFAEVNQKYRNEVSKSLTERELNQGRRRLAAELGIDVRIPNAERRNQRFEHYWNRTAAGSDPRNPGPIFFDTEQTEDLN